MNNTRVRLMVLPLLFSSAAALANTVQNGDFEQWSGNTPASWTTIDSGLSLSPETVVVKQGATAARIDLTTSNQADADFRQSVSVTAGQSYTFSTWVYHTEGGAKARLYVDGYQNYSDPGLVNQWQLVSFDYTAGTTTSIEIGLRFYDVTGFDGNETIYVDDFQPSAATSTPPPAGCSDHNLTLSLLTDNYGAETSWQITQGTTTVASGNGLASNTQYNEAICLTDGDYTFTIFDSYGDGICCTYGSGNYALSEGSTTLASGASFTSSESTAFTLGTTGGGNTGGGNTGGGNTDPGAYYSGTEGLSGYALKTALFNIIAGHNNQGYSSLWNFYDSSSRDVYFENDNSILDMYGERPNGADGHVFAAVSNQCGTYSGEGDCYNREHSFPKSWFGGQVEPMHSDVHHIFATDGYVNSKRSNYPFGEVGTASYTSSNGSKLGSASVTLGYTGTVFEPIDEFKGDFARAWFYMATRYQDKVASWQTNTTYSDAVLNGTSDQVFETWVIAMLLRWNQQDPVSQMELDRNQAAYDYQGNRNPFVDHPEYASAIWGQ